MPEEPSREPSFTLSARYLSRLAKLERERRSRALDPTPEVAEKPEGAFSEMIGFSEQGGEPGTDSAAPPQPAPPAAGRGSEA